MWLYLGQQLRAESNDEAILARIVVLRVLQAHVEVPKESATTIRHSCHISIAVAARK